MSADLLREAATLMRERATSPGVLESPWFVEVVDYGEEGNVLAVGPSGDPYPYDVARQVTPAADGSGNADHIASWHPAVALAVADWLDVTAKNSAPYRAEFPQALAVARTYLGEQP